MPNTELVNPSAKLENLAQAEFPSLTPAELKLLRSIHTGNVLFCGPNINEKDPENDPMRGRDWGTDREVRATLIRWLCTDQIAKAQVMPPGLQLFGAKIAGLLDLSTTSLSFALRFIRCMFTNDIFLLGTRLSDLSLSGSFVPGLIAENAVVEGNILLRGGLQASGRVSLMGAKAGGDLDCSGSRFSNTNGEALNAEGITVGRNILFNDGFRASNTVNLVGARVAASLDCHDGAFGAPRDGIALDAHSCKVKGSVILTGKFTANGLTNLAYTEIGQQLLCDGGRFINPEGLAILAEGANVGGAVFLRNRFSAEGEVRISNARVGQLECDNSTISNLNKTALSADGLVCQNSVYLRNRFHSVGETILTLAQIGGLLDCTDAKFSNPGKSALRVDFAKIKGSILFNNTFVAEGQVLLRNSEIASLECHGSEFINRDQIALHGEGLVTRGSVFLTDGFCAVGETRFPAAQIGGQFVCSNATLVNPGKDALIANGVEVKDLLIFGNQVLVQGKVRLMRARVGSLQFEAGIFSHSEKAAIDAEGLTSQGSVLFLSGFQAEGEVRLHGAAVGGNLECRGKIVNQNGYTLNAEDAVISGDFFLSDDFSGLGETRLLGSHIRGQLNCDNGSFSNPGGLALDSDTAEIYGGVFLRHRFTAQGEVRFVGTRVTGNIECSGGKFYNPLGNALNAERVQVSGAILLRDHFRADGATRLVSAEIGSNLECNDGNFINPNGSALDARGVVIHGSVLLCCGFSASGLVSFLAAHIRDELDYAGARFEGSTLDLTGSSAAALRDDTEGWPSRGHLRLNGFVYQRISEGPQDWESRLKWLQLQPDKPFPSLSYVQLAKVLKEGGDEYGGNRVLEQMEQEEYRNDSSLAWRGWGAMLGLGVDYGYNPLKALMWEGFSAGLGWIIYRRGYVAGSIVPTERSALEHFVRKNIVPSHHPKFSALIYSLENSLPIVKLGQADKWHPGSKLSEIPVQEQDKSPAPSAWISGLETLLNRAGLWNFGKWIAAVFGLTPQRSQPSSSKIRQFLSRSFTSPRQLRGFLWLQILVGWLLATLLIAGITALVSKTK